MQLIADINQERLYRMGPKLAAGKVSTPVQEWWSQRFPDVPQRIWDHMVGQDLGMPKGEDLPWNRRSRRRFDQAKGLVIHMFSGDAPSSKKWTQGWPPGVEVITVDTSTNPLQDVHQAAVWGYLCHLAATKPIIAVIGGPPCRSVSRLRNVRPGPVPLRGRYEDRFGLPGLSAADQLKADRDAALVLKQQGLLWIAEEHRALDSPPVGYLMESPEDPKVAFGEEDAPSFWSWPEVISFAERFGLGTVSFDQGMYGHQQRKPPTCLTNLPLMGHLHGARCSTNIGEGLHENLQQRFAQTASWSSWAPGLKKAIHTSLLLLCHMHGFGNQGIKKVLDVQGWKQHIHQGHVPYRRDCRACIMDMGSGKPHRRQIAGGTASWTMAVDMVQMPSGVDETTGYKAKYMLLATVAVPQFGDQASGTQGADDKGQKGEGIPTEPPNSESSDGPPVDDWGEGLDETMFPLEPPADMDADKPEKLESDPVISKPPSGERPDLGVEPDMSQLVDACSAPLQVQQVTIIHPMESRHASQVVHGLNTVLTRFKYMGIHVVRVHSDRAKEFLSHTIQKWIAAQGIVQTMTSGDDPAANGRAESEVHQVKRRVRFLLSQSGEPLSHWPVAARYAAEQRMRVQLSKLGCNVLPMLPFFSQVAVKRKRWHQPGALAPPFVSARLLCASHLMSSGWVVRTDQGQVMHVREAVLPSPLGDEVALQLQEQPRGELVMSEEPHPAKPRMRVYGKQPPEGQVRFSVPRSLDAPGEGAASVLGPLLRGSALDAPLGGAASSSCALDAPAGAVGDLDGDSDGYSQSILDDADVGALDPEEPSGGEPLGGSGSGPSISKMVEQSVVRRVKTGFLKDVLEENHQQVLSQMDELLNQVPMGEQEGKTYGSSLANLQQERENLEHALTELEQLEKRNLVKLCSTQVTGSLPSNVHLGENGEVLQTVVVSLDEVKKDIQSWVPAMLSEYRSLTEETQAIEKVDVNQLDDSAVEYVPGKLVCTVKAGPNGGRKKCRGVICGNLLDSSSDPLPGSAYASGADGPLIRTVLHHGVQRGWGASTVDIKTAFLLAPRPVPESGRETIVVPPRILVLAGVCSPTERWRVRKALYGFQSSPARWAGHRDGTLKVFRWIHEDGCGFYLQNTPEVNLWRIMKQKLKEGINQHTMVPQTNDECVGHLVVYVDDLLVVGPQSVRQGFLQRLSQEWTTSKPERL